MPTLFRQQRKGKTDLSLLLKCGSQIFNPTHEDHCPCVLISLGEVWFELLVTHTRNKNVANKREECYLPVNLREATQDWQPLSKSLLYHPSLHVFKTAAAAPGSTQTSQAAGRRKGMGAEGRPSPMSQSLKGIIQKAFNGPIKRLI